MVTVPHHVNVASNEHLEDLWHQRFGHLSNNNLRLLRDQKLVSGMDFQSVKESDFCEGCAHGKQKRASFPKGQATRASKILQIVHSDGCGPMQENSLDGSRYFVTFIDDKSRFTATVAHRCHGTNKNVTAQTKTSQHKQERHGTNKNLTAQTRTSRHKQKLHGANKNLTAQTNTN